jgi:hypothetical protein
MNGGATIAAISLSNFCQRVPYVPDVIAMNQTQRAPAIAVENGSHQPVL